MEKGGNGEDCSSYAVLFLFFPVGAVVVSISTVFLSVCPSVGRKWRWQRDCEKKIIAISRISTMGTTIDRTGDIDPWQWIIRSTNIATDLQCARRHDKLSTCLFTSHDGLHGANTNHHVAFLLQAISNIQYTIYNILHHHEEQERHFHGTITRKKAFPFLSTKRNHCQPPTEIAMKFEMPVICFQPPTKQRWMPIVQ